MGVRALHEGERRHPGGLAQAWAVPMSAPWSHFRAPERDHVPPEHRGIVARGLR